MNMNDLIIKKRDGGVLSEAELRFMVEGYTREEIPDYQMSAMLMAVFFKGMNKEETYALTAAMRDSGDTADLSSIEGIKVDKHSTGGVGDKTTLIAAPIAAACGVPIAKMSGRGLGFTGGTVDKLESIPGFQTALSEEVFLKLVNQNGISVIGQTGKIAPADKKLYALRDVTGTVENLSLITSSIMSKKLASGSDRIVLDVKCGEGAFMETMEEAEKLGKRMTEIGNADGKKTVAVITDMNQPLGNAVGNSLEVIEAIETLKGAGPRDITELSVTLAGMMIFLGEKARTAEQGIEKANRAIRDGSALEKLRLLIEGQGGDPGVIEDTGRFARPAFSAEVLCPHKGVVAKLHAKTVGIASQHAGAGRMTKEDSVDLSAGVYLRSKVGSPVEKGETLATVFGNDEKRVRAAAGLLESAWVIADTKLREQALVKKVIGL